MILHVEPVHGQGAKVPGNAAKAARCAHRTPQMSRSGKTAAIGARDDAQPAGSHKELAQALPKALTHAPRSLMKEGEDDSDTDGSAPVRWKTCV